MASKDLRTREDQKARYLRLSEIRQGALQEKGLNEAAILKDPEIKRLKAKIKQINSALARISFLDEQTKKLQEKKEQRIAEAAAARAAAIAGETQKKDKAKAGKEAPAPSKKKPAAGKAPAAGAKGQPKKKGK